MNDQYPPGITEEDIDAQFGDESQVEELTPCFFCGKLCKEKDCQKCDYELSLAGDEE